MASTQILLLLECSKQNTPSSTLEKYALLPKKLLSDRPVLEAVRCNGFQVVVDRNFKFNKNVTFDLITAQIVHGATRRDNVLIYVEELLKDFVQQLFKKNVEVSSLSTTHKRLSDGYLKIIKKLLTSGSKINYKSADGSTFLHFITETGPANVFDLLLRKQPDDINAKGKDSATPLHIVTEQMSMRRVTLLIENGADVNAKMTDGSTPLILAAKGGSLNIVKLLITNCACVNDKMNNGATPLRLAFEGRDTNKIIELLITSGANADFILEDGSTPIILAVEKDSLKIVELLIAKGANVNAEKNDGSTSLHIAARKGHTDIAEYLLSHNANVDRECNWCISSNQCRSSTPLHVAVFYGYQEIVALLLEKGANVNAKMEDGTTPLFIAAWQGYTQIVKCLLHYDVNVHIKSEWFVNRPSSTPLHIAVHCEHHEIVALLLEKGANINDEFSNGQTPLSFAVSKCHLELCEVLAKFNPDVNSAKNKEAFRIVLSYLDKCYRQVSLCLLDCGFDVTVEDVGNPDLLFGAIAQHLHQVVEKLLTLGASPNWRHCGEMPLHKAAACGDEDMIRLLLDHGADINAVISGNTPLSTAIRFSNVQTARALIANNADVQEPPELLHSAVKYLENCANVTCNTNREKLAHVAVRYAKLDVFEMMVKFGVCVGGVRHLDFQYFYGELEVEAYLNFDFTQLHPDSVENTIRNCFNHLGWCSEKSKILGCFLVKLAVAYEVNGFEELLPYKLQEDLQLDDLKVICMTEIAEMKENKMGRSSVSFFDILTGNTWQVSRFLRNDIVSKILKDFNVSAAFPNYGPIIECQIRKGTWRRESLDKGIQLFGLLFSEFSGLPEDIKEDMVDYLSNQEILILQNALNSE